MPCDDGVSLNQPSAYVIIYSSATPFFLWNHRLSPTSGLWIKLIQWVLAFLITAKFSQSQYILFQQFSVICMAMVLYEIYTIECFMAYSIMLL